MVSDPLTEAWDEVERQVKLWREACCLEEAKGLLSYLTGNPDHRSGFGGKSGKESFSDELHKWLDEEKEPSDSIHDRPNQRPFHTRIADTILLTFINGADDWKELVYALAGEVVELQGRLDDAMSGDEMGGN